MCNIYTLLKNLLATLLQEYLIHCIHSTPLHYLKSDVYANRRTRVLPLLQQHCYKIMLNPIAAQVPFDIASIILFPVKKARNKKKKGTSRRQREEKKSEKITH